MAAFAAYTVELVGAPVPRRPTMRPVEVSPMGGVTLEMWPTPAPTSSRGWHGSPEVPVIVTLEGSIFVPELEVLHMEVRVQGVDAAYLRWRPAPGVTDGVVDVVGGPLSRRKARLIRRGKALVDDVRRRGHPFDEDWRGAARLSTAVAAAIDQLHRDGRPITRELVLTTLVRVPEGDIGAVDQSSVDDRLRRFGLPTLGQTISEYLAVHGERRRRERRPD